MQASLQRVASLLISCSLAACTGGADGLAVDDPGGAGKSDSGAAATLRFEETGWPSVSQKLVAGQSARLVYDLDRLSGCRSDKWAMTAHVRGSSDDDIAVALTKLQDGEVVPVDARFTIPEGPSVAVWFTVHDRYGCIAYDSNDGNDYHFDVVTRPQATVHFDADWSETVDGTLRKDGIVNLDYDLARLPACNATAFAKYKLDGGKVQTAQLFPTSDDRAAASLTVPASASSLELWFERVSRYGCNEVDSDYGNNYHFDLQ